MLRPDVPAKNTPRESLGHQISSFTRVFYRRSQFARNFLAGVAPSWQARVSLCNAPSIKNTHGQRRHLALVIYKLLVKNRGKVGIILSINHRDEIDRTDRNQKTIRWSQNIYIYIYCEIVNNIRLIKCLQNSALCQLVNLKSVAIYTGCNLINCRNSLRDKMMYVNFLK